MTTQIERHSAVPFSPRRVSIGVALLVAAGAIGFGMRAFRGSVGTPAESPRHGTTARVATTHRSTATLPSTTPTTLPEVVLGKVGPWGQLEIVPIVIELPDQYTDVTAAERVFNRWSFTGRDRAMAMSFLRSLGLSDAELALLSAAEWTDTGTTSTVTPPDALLLGLTPGARQRLYAALATDPANADAISPFWFQEGRVDFRLRGSDLSDASRAVLNRLLYPGANGTILFNDLFPALRAIPDQAEKVRFFKAVTRKRAVMARLRIDEQTDIDALVDYWGAQGRRAAVQPLLEAIKYNALAGVESPGMVNVATLLPPFAQERLYRHGTDNHPVTRGPDDCYWSTFNFFSDKLDERNHDGPYIVALLQRDYVRIDAPSELGDVILVGDDAGNSMHAANYIADDIVFTKNGNSSHQPWVLTSMESMLNTYRAKNPKLSVAYFRKRN